MIASFPLFFFWMVLCIKIHCGSIDFNQKMIKLLELVEEWNLVKRGSIFYSSRKNNGNKIIKRLGNDRLIYCLFSGFQSTLRALQYIYKSLVKYIVSSDSESRDLVIRLHESFNLLCLRLKLQTIKKQQLKCTWVCGIFDLKLQNIV